MSQIKNIAIIAHVDHGKTTLVDKIMHHCELFRVHYHESIEKRREGIDMLLEKLSILLPETEGSLEIFECSLPILKDNWLVAKIKHKKMADIFFGKFSELISSTGEGNNAIFTFIRFF